MPTVGFLGKIEPAACNLNFDFVPEVHYQITEANIALACRIKIENSTVTVTCEVDRWGDDVVPWILNYVFDFVNAEIDLVIFASGRAFSVHLDTLVLPDGSQQLMLPDAPDVRGLATACSSLMQNDGGFKVEIKDIFVIVCTRPALILAPRNLCAAIKFGNNTLANCGRAVEGMRKSMWGKDEQTKEEEKRSWAKFRDNLNLSKIYVQSVTDPSRQPRHGSAAYISPVAKKDALTKSWTIMNRCCSFIGTAKRRCLATFTQSFRSFPRERGRAVVNGVAIVSALRAFIPNAKRPTRFSHYAESANHA